jgi:hypothetical protein
MEPPKDFLFGGVCACKLDVVPEEGVRLNLRPIVRGHIPKCGLERFVGDLVGNTVHPISLLTCVPFLRGASKLHPFLGKPQPSHFIGRTNRDLCKSDAFFGFIEIPIHVAISHR